MFELKEGKPLASRQGLGKRRSHADQKRLDRLTQIRERQIYTHPLSPFLRDFPRFLSSSEVRRTPATIAGILEYTEYLLIYCRDPGRKLQPIYELARTKKWSDAYLDFLVKKFRVFLSSLPVTEPALAAFLERLPSIPQPTHLKSKTVPEPLPEHALTPASLPLLREWAALLDNTKIKIVRLTRDVSPLTEEEVMKLERYLISGGCATEVRLLFYLCLDLGLRNGEVTSLRFADFEGDYVRFTRGKGGKVSTLPLSNRLRILVELYKRERKAVGTELVLSSFGEGLKKKERNGIRNMMTRHLERAGISKSCATHRLRHTFASRLVGQNINLFVLKEMLGHSSVRMTERYLHLQPSALKKAMEDVRGKI